MTEFFVGLTIFLGFIALFWVAGKVAGWLNKHGKVSEALAAVALVILMLFIVIAFCYTLGYTVLHGTLYS